MQITKTVENLPKNPIWVLAPDKALISFATPQAIYCRAIVTPTYKTNKAMLFTFEDGVPLFHDKDRRKFKYYKARNNATKELWLPINRFYFGYNEGVTELGIDFYLTTYKIPAAMFHRYSNFSLTTK